jgi:tRNA pseudouridine38-40 synthase
VKRRRFNEEGPPPGWLRLRLLVAYEGSGFDGWQSQASGNAVQDFLERAVAGLVGERRVVHGSGRTDSGVHALGQVAHVDVPEERLPVDAWVGALNAQLPQGVRVLEARRAPHGFHARFSAVGKEYVYRLWNDRTLHPLEAGRVWHLPTPLDRDTLRQCALRLQGSHDFAGFAANRGKPEKSTVRTITALTLKTAGPLLTLRFAGNGFLYRMVRMLAGSMVRVAQGKADLAWMEELLLRPAGRRTSFCAPAEGLYLKSVRYR